MYHHELLDEEHAVKIGCGQPEAGVRKLESTIRVQQASDVLIMPQSRTKRTSTTEDLTTILVDEEAPEAGCSEA